MPYTGLTIVIPTRNRASLAINTIRSVLDQSSEDVQILVSDNSTLHRESTELAEFCGSLTTERARYMAPPSPMSMSHHWDWAMVQTLKRSESSHITFLTDRMLLRNGTLSETIKIAKNYPNHILSYNHDKIVDHEFPIRLLQSPSSGRVFELQSDQLLSLVSQAFLHNCLPRMLNAVAPRSRLLEIQSEFGNIFDSISPDFCFCFRVLEKFDTIIYFDKSVFVHYALSRSNGESAATGKNTVDHKDFMENLGGNSLNFAAPIPKFLTVFNAICHEYCLVREQTKSSRFPEIDIEAYLGAIAYEVSQIENLQLRLGMEKLLVTHGWQGNQKKTRDPRTLFRKLVSARTVLNRLRWLSGGSYAKRMWLILADRLSLRPPDDNRFGFQSVEEALEYANRFPRRHERDTCLGEPLASGEDLEVSLL